MVISRMSSGQIIRACGLSLAASLFTVGCFTKKSEEVAESTAAPPPAAYPAGEASTSSDGAYAAPAPDAPASTAYTPAPQRSVEPAPFSLQANEQLVAHRIEKGDTLGVIAKQYGTTVSRIKSANGMTSDTIYAGKTIQVPSTGLPSLAANAPASSAPAPASTPASATSYRSPSAGGSSSGGYTGTDGSTEPYPRVESSSPPTQSGSAFPTPSFGGSSIQFSD